MTWWVWVAVGIVVLWAAWEGAPKLGGLLLAVVALGALLAAWKTVGAA
jgi:hypothetical protein